MLKPVTMLLCAVLLALPLAVQAQGGDSDHPLAAEFQQAIDAGLVTEFEESQTLDGYTVTLNRAYVDTGKLAVYYTVEGETASPELILNTAPELSHDGNMFAGQGLAMPYPDNGKTYTTFYNQTMSEEGVIDDYFHTAFDEVPEEVTLDLSIRVFEVSIEAQALPFEIAEDAPIFEFEFTVPVYEARTLTPEIEVTAADLTMTLTELTISPIQTQATICYDIPDPGDWQPDMMGTALSVDDESGLMAGISLLNYRELADDHRCVKLRYNLYTPADAETLTLTIDRLQGSLPETREFWEAVQADVAEQGIEIDIFPEGYNTYYMLTGMPDEMSEPEAYLAIEEAQQANRDSVEGPWEFTVDLSAE